jgi:adenylate cyclase
VRAEFEYEIPPQDAGEMLEKFCANAVVSKIRRRLVWKNHSWEVDEFLGDNEGLWLAEIELDERNEAFEFPQWLGNEVTGDEKFYNTYLSMHPFASW